MENLPYTILLFHVQPTQENKVDSTHFMPLGSLPLLHRFLDNFLMRSFIRIVHQPNAQPISTPAIEPPGVPEKRFPKKVIRFPKKNTDRTIR